MKSCTQVRCGLEKGAPLDTTTSRPEEVFSLSSRKGGEGWGEEASFMECPSPHTFTRSEREKISGVDIKKLRP
jgi:hypothetical protein